MTNDDVNIIKNQKSSFWSRKRKHLHNFKQIPHRKINLWTVKMMSFDVIDEAKNIHSRVGRPCPSASCGLLEERVAYIISKQIRRS